jgi:hypothetical protein
VKKDPCDPCLRVFAYALFFFSPAATIQPTVDWMAQNLKRRNLCRKLLIRKSTMFNRSYSAQKPVRHETEMSTLGRSSAHTASTSWIKFFLNAAISPASPARP